MDGIKKVSKDVRDILENVRENGDEAVLFYINEKFDFKGRPEKEHIKPEEIEVYKHEWDQVIAELDDDIKKVIDGAAANIRYYHENQKIEREYEIRRGDTLIKDRLISIEKAGIYVPGGNYPYPSTVLMCAIPAKVAGVKELVMVTPPKNMSPAVLYAARVAGVDRVFRVGGAQSVAALAYGTEMIPKVDIIVGPGNIYVQCAKMLVSDVVGIDMLSGPSEVVIIADKHQDPELVAVDLMSQAEHASDAEAVLITDSEKLIEKVKGVKEGFSGKFEGTIKYELVDSIDMAAEKSNRIAPEHLELMCSEENIAKIEGKISNAGAVFVGSDTPVASGDYWAGPSHALPTSRAARYSEGLSVRTFLKKVSFIRCGKDAVKNEYGAIAKFAKEEGMEYHARSIELRIKKQGD
jgi:histidinol dehydrogenase